MFESFKKYLNLQNIVKLYNKHFGKNSFYFDDVNFSNISNYLNFKHFQ
jgi:hypothetical protein